MSSPHLYRCHCPPVVLIHVAKDGIKGFFEVMGVVVFKDLDHGHQGRVHEAMYGSRPTKNYSIQGLTCHYVYVYGQTALDCPSMSGNKNTSANIEK